MLMGGMAVIATSLAVTALWAGPHPPAHREIGDEIGDEFGDG
jgi:hypothetical protein